MAVPQYIASGALAGSTATSISVSAPTCQNNDILVLVVGTYAADAIAADNSYTELYDTGQAHVYWKRTTGTEGTTTVSGASNSVAGFIACIRGCITSGSPLGSETPGTASGTDASVEVASFSTNLDEELVCCCGDMADNNSQTGVTYGNLANTFVNIGGTNAGDDAMALLWGGTLATAGSIGSPVWTANGSDAWNSYVFALKPVPPSSTSFDPMGMMGFFGM